MGSSSLFITFYLWNKCEIRINNNSQYKTGYAATTENGDRSTTEVAMWNTPTGYLASTTGNITGVYDMSGGVSEYVMGVVKGCKWEFNVRLFTIF